MGEVRALPGVIQKAERGFVDQEVVSRLETFLADAKAGVIKGIAYAAMSTDDMIKVSWVGSHATENAMHGAIALLAAYFARQRLRQMDEDG